MMLKRQNYHPSAQAEALCLARRCGCHEQTIWHQRIAREVVFGKPTTPVAQLLQQPHLYQLLLIALLARQPLTAVTEHKMRKVHGVYSSLVRPLDSGNTLSALPRLYQRSLFSGISPFVKMRAIHPQILCSALSAWLL